MSSTQLEHSKNFTNLVAKIVSDHSIAISDALRVISFAASTRSLLSVAVDSIEHGSSVPATMFARVFAIVMVGFVACVAGLLTDEACPSDVTAMKDFSLNDYTGRWFEIKRYEQFYERDLDCVVAEYQKTGDDSISMKNGAFSLSNNTRVVSEGTGVVSYPDDVTHPAKLSVAYFGAKPKRSNYWVLDTDYTSFAVVWSCEPFFKDASKNVLGFWIFSRNPTFPTDEAVVKRVDELVKKYGDASKFEVPNQSDERCPRSY
ncbi:apolipoprotein D-like [Anopheles marshallii]|uniref:apolipoprotein D-like n=1 Tax=Anopheles marshallii TaxID=1521116 RepID=UPI00237BC2A0|nr:apolipoprotein D-like [Anopheles marshallii]